MLMLERETRVAQTGGCLPELATLCLGSTGWAGHITSVVEHLPPRQRVVSSTCSG